MPNYATPGVYIEEIEMGSKPIEGVSTSTAAFIGAAQKGGILEPTLVTSWSQFNNAFGDFISSPRIHLAYAVDAYFRNGGKNAYIVRVASPSTAKARAIIQNKGNKNAIVLEALDYGSDGNKICFSTADSSISGDVAVFQNQVDVISISDKDITVNDANYFEIGDRVIVSDGTKYEEAVIAATRVSDVAPNIITVTEDIKTSFTSGSIKLRTADIETADKKVRLTRSDGFFPGTIVYINDTKDSTKSDYGIVDKVEGQWLFLQTGVTNKYLLDGSTTINAASLEFNISFCKAGFDDEDYKKLSIEPRHPYYFRKQMASKLVAMTLWDPPAAATPAGNLLPKAAVDQYLAGGMDDDLMNITYTDGLTPLEKYDGISLLAIPGQTDQATQKAMIDHCISKHYRFAILDSQYQAGVTGTDSVMAQRDKLATDKGFAALYYPWIQIVDPVSKDLIYIPPSGAVAGIYARSDGQRGVHKAPANESVAGAIGLEKLITQGEQDILNPRGINAIRFFPGRGYLVWGARTLASGGSDPSWKYVNVRRLFMFLEESIETATQWAVFEPNNEKLWARVRATISEFLTRVWRDGALMGTKAEQAFFVKCDETTMTQSDIDNGRLVCVIGVAPVKPAEFVIFQIAQWAGGSSSSD